TKPAPPWDSSTAPANVTKARRKLRETVRESRTVERWITETVPSAQHQIRVNIPIHVPHPPAERGHVEPARVHCRLMELAGQNHEPHRLTWGKRLRSGCQRKPVQDEP